MRLLKLYNKFQMSGTKDNPTITNKELILLKEKFEEFIEFSDAINSATIGLKMHKMSVSQMILSRTDSSK